VDEFGDLGHLKAFSFTISENILKKSYLQQALSALQVIITPLRSIGLVGQG